MKELFYYLRGVRNGVSSVPIVTVCLMTNSVDVIVRGIAICSTSEQPVKEKGREIAWKRAAMAIYFRGSFEWIKRYESFNALKSLTLPYFQPGFSWYKSHYDVLLTEYERKLVNKSFEATFIPEHIAGAEVAVKLAWKQRLFEIEACKKKQRISQRQKEDISLKDFFDHIQLFFER